MTWTLAVVNQKGGVGKTTTAVNLATGLALAGRRVLVIDGDPQGNATSGLGIRKGAPGVQHLRRPGQQRPPRRDHPAGCRRAGSGPACRRIWTWPGPRWRCSQEIRRENILKKALRPILGQYQYVLMDGPPSLGLLTLNILTAADAVLIPIQCEYYALEGISQLMNIVERVQSHLNPKLEVGLVVLTMHDERVNLSRQVVTEVRAFFGEKVARTVVPRNVRLSEAPSFGQPIEMYDPKSKGAQAYIALAQEVIALGKD